MAVNLGYILGVDIGATHLRFILAEQEKGRLDCINGKNSKRFFPSPLSEDPQVFSDLIFAHVPDSEKVPVYIVQKLEIYLKELGISKKAIHGIGVSVAGNVQADGRFIGSNVPLRYAVKKNNSYGVDLIPALREIFHDDIAIIIENDANCAGIAQGMYYEQMGHDPYKTFFITVSTGIGGGGPKRDLDEVGHIIVDGYFPGLVPACGCGASGCIEAYASGEGIRNQARSILDMFFNNSQSFNNFHKFEEIRTEGRYDLNEIINCSRLKRLYLDGGNIDTKTIFDFSNLTNNKTDTDMFAYYLIETAAERLAKVLYSLSNIHGIERFGIGGSVAINNPGYLDIVQKKIKLFLKSEDIFKNEVKIEVSPFGESVTDYGALLLVVDQVYKKNWIDTIIKSTGL